MAYSLDDMILKPIEAVIAGAYSHGRNVFYEHDVYAVTKAAMEQAGIIVANSMMDHGDFIKTFALLNDFSVTRKRVVIMAIAGFSLDSKTRISYVYILFNFTFKYI